MMMLGKNFSDGETFISADDLRINLWNLEISNQSFNIVDVKPSNMEDLTGRRAFLLPSLVLRTIVLVIYFYYHIFRSHFLLLVKGASEYLRRQFFFFFSPGSLKEPVFDSFLSLFGYIVR